MNILLVDDIVINRFIIREIVRKLGHTFAEAADGKIAIELFRNQHFDLIFMDIEMPVMNGLETVKYIRNNFPEPKRSIKICALTAYNPSILQDSIDFTGFDNLVTKPYSVEKIQNILSSY